MKMCKKWSDKKKKQKERQSVAKRKKKQKMGPIIGQWAKEKLKSKENFTFIIFIKIEN